MEVPSSYIDGYKKARRIAPVLATNYIDHTTIGDPLADALIADLAQLPAAEAEHLIKQALTENEAVPATAPASLENFIHTCAQQPPWLDFEQLQIGCRMFHRNTQLAIAAMAAGVLVEGFATNIAQSFFLTGGMRHRGVRRLRQNNRHMLEIFMPGGLSRYGDGWALTIRIRLVHAKIRHLLANSDDWDTAHLGLPISAAHLGYAIAAFSARLLQFMKSLGASYSEEEQAGFMAVWRYCGHLMGVPETILFREQADALELLRIGRLCEPASSVESIAMASSLIHSIPLVIGHSDSQERKRMAHYVFKVSRALIGNELADELRLPPSRTWGVLWQFRFLTWLETIAGKLNPRGTRVRSKITMLLDFSHFESEGVNYKLPDHQYADRSSEW